MEKLRIEAGDIADLATPVAMHGAIGMGDAIGSDQVFDIIVGVVALVVETRH